MRTDVTTVTPDTPIADVVSLLLRRGRRSLPVIDAHHRVLGIITDGDLLRRAALPVRLDLQEQLSEQQVREQVLTLQRAGKTAGDIMTQPIVSVQTSDTVQQAMNLMVKRGLKRLPVVDNERRLAGWISRVDVLRTLEYHHLPEESSPRAGKGWSVSQLMYERVPTIMSTAGLEEIVQVLERGHFRRAVVVDGDKRVVGIITDGDLLRRSSLARHPGLLARLRSLISGQQAPVTLPETQETAGELMTTPVVTIDKDTPLVDALRLMLAHECKRLPVVDDSGRLVGLLGRANLLRGLLREKDEDGEDALENGDREP